MGVARDTKASLQKQQKASLNNKKRAGNNAYEGSFGSPQCFLPPPLSASPPALRTSPPPASPMQQFSTACGHNL
jgi:hypothetical protein